VLDHLRPRLVLFGAEAPSAPELGPRTGARIGARLLSRARATRGDQVELRDRDGGYVRASDGGAAVVLIGGNTPAVGACDDNIDLVVLVMPGGADPRIELAGTAPAEAAHAAAAVIALGDDVVGDAAIVAGARRVARLIGAQLVGGPAAVRAGAVAPGAVVDRVTPIAPEVCVAVGSPALDLAGMSSSIKVGSAGGKTVVGALPGLPGPSLAELARVLEES
jgi:hypothetical protein